MKRILFLIIFMVLFMSFCKKGEIEYDKKWEEGLKSENIKRFEKAEREKLAELEGDFSNPNLYYIDNKYFYVIDNYENAYIYKTDDYSFYKKFGRKGEGPGEWRLFSGAYFYPNKNKIMIYGMGKIIYYTKEGEYLSEFKYIEHPKPIGKNYVRTDYYYSPENEENDSYLESNVLRKKIILLDSEFKDKKILVEKDLIGAKYVYKGSKIIAWCFSPVLNYRTYEDKIVIGYSNKESFDFWIFDSKGREIRRIRKRYFKMEVPREIKDKLVSSNYKSRANHNKKVNYKFFKYYPSFSNFEVYDGKIYVYMYPEKGMQRVMIMDMKGRFINSILIPFEFEDYRDFHRSVDNYNGYEYFILLSEDEKKWELWREKRFEFM